MLYSPGGKIRSKITINSIKLGPYHPQTEFAIIIIQILKDNIIFIIPSGKYHQEEEGDNLIIISNLYAESAAMACGVQIHLNSACLE